MDMRTFGRMFLGRKPGQTVTEEEFEADKKAYEYYIKKSIDNRFDPEILNTQQGMYARYDGTNAVAIAPMVTNAQGEMVRGDVLKGYAADPYSSDAGAPAPVLGGGTFAGTNAPTAAPTPVPSPTPSFVAEATVDEIRQRFPQAPANLVPGMTIRLNNGGVIVVK
jgi:hypothetical protein